MLPGYGYAPPPLDQQQLVMMLVQQQMATAGSAPTQAVIDAAQLQFAPPQETAIKGFTTKKYANPTTPSYIPPEAFVLNHGLFLNAFLARCAINDYTRLIQQEQEASYFANNEDIIKATFDSKGNRVNTAAEMLTERNTRNLDYLKRQLAKFKDETVREGEVSRKYFFKPQHISMIGSLFGARGETQKKLVRDAGVLRIEFAGRGLTKRQKKFNAIRGLDKADELESEEPHAFIVGYDEASVGRAIERIEWLLSDTPDAVATRENNRVQLMVKDGTYDALTYKAKEVVGGAVGSKREREVEETKVDEELDAFLDD